MAMFRLLLVLFLFLAGPAFAEGAAEKFRADARSIEKLINDNYAYLDRFESQVAPVSAKLRAEADQVGDRRSLLKFAERMLLILADHHAITAASTAESWAVVPTYSDLWVDKRGREFVIDAVRQGSPAERAGIVVGDRLVALDGIPLERAVADFWSGLGLAETDERAGFAARVLAAGRRHVPRRLGVRTKRGTVREVELPNLYTLPPSVRPFLTATQRAGELVIRFHDSLAQEGTIASFDRAMAQASPGQRVVIDLTDTPSGGNTVVARAIMGWFVSKPAFYQVHNLPAEERRTGIGRQWFEQVLPRAGKRHAGPVLVRVGRWTGSMGEGLAVGFDALGAEVVGGPMAGLLGAIYDHRLEHSGLVLKIPTERLFAVDGSPRERFVPGGATR